MASIQKRDNGRWRARYRDAAGKEHARHFTRKVDAQRWLDEITADVLTGRYVDPGRGKITFRAYFDSWSARQTWADGTLEAARRATKDVPFADVPLSKISPEHIQMWLKAMTQAASSRKSGLAVTTQRTRFDYVRMVFRAAVRDKRIPVDPMEDIKPPKVKRKVDEGPTIPSEDDVRRLLDAAKPDFWAFLAVCAFAGLRLGEAAGLQRGDVDFLKRTLRVDRQVQGDNVASTTVCDPKAGSHRTVDVPEALTVILARHIEDVGLTGEEGWLFSDSAGHLLHRNSAGHRFRETAKAAGISGYTLHSLRHFYASGLIEQGCDVVTVQRALGHSDATVTLKVYAHAWRNAEDKTRAAAADLMDRVLGTPADSLRTTGSRNPL